MKKCFLFTFFCSVAAVSLAAQTSVSSSPTLPPPPVVQDPFDAAGKVLPPSTIDYLKQTLSNSGIESLASPSKGPSGPSVAPKAKAEPSAPKKEPTSTAPAPSVADTKQTKSPQKETPKPLKTSVEEALENNNALLGDVTPKKEIKAADLYENIPAPIAEDAAAQAELDYAARMLQQEKEQTKKGRFIPAAASKTADTAPTPKNKKFDPNDYRPGITWVKSKSTHFEIYTQKRDSGIGSSNMSMIFEGAYATLRRNIPWMMSSKVRVFVYQDHGSYLKHEPNAKAWTRALAYPIRGEIVVYDEPGKQKELKEIFTHELVHIFTQKFFDKHGTNRLVTPIWLDEGLAVYMEDQAYNGIKGGPWANDFKVLNLQRSKDSPTEEFGSSYAKTFQPTSRRRGKAVTLMPFGMFIQDGSLAAMESRGKTQNWYLQAYLMVRFLLNPANTSSPSNRMQFEQFTRLLAQGEQVRDPSTGFLKRDEKGKPVYQPYSVEKALGKAYRYNSAAAFEDAFWDWAKRNH